MASSGDESTLLSPSFWFWSDLGENFVVRKSGSHKNLLGLEVNLIFGHPYEYHIFRNASFSRVGASPSAFAFSRTRVTAPE